MKYVGVFALLCACFSPCYGQAAKAAASGEAEALQQLERDWTDAQKAGDIDKLSRIVGDD